MRLDARPRPRTIQEVDSLQAALAALPDEERDADCLQAVAAKRNVLYGHPWAVH